MIDVRRCMNEPFAIGDVQGTRCHGVENLQGATSIWLQEFAIGFSEFSLDFFSATPLREVYPNLPPLEPSVIIGDLELTVSRSFMEHPTLQTCVVNGTPIYSTSGQIFLSIPSAPNNFQHLEIKCSLPITFFRFSPTGALQGYDDLFYAQRLSFKKFTAQQDLDLVAGAISILSPPIEADGNSTNMLITDPQGRRSGYNSFTQQSFSEIPGASYFSAESLSSPDDATAFTKPEVRFEGLEPVVGNYRVQVFAPTSTNYSVTSYNFDSTGTINGISSKQGSLRAGSSVEVEISHTAQEIPIRMAALNIKKADFYDSRRRDFAFIQGQIKPIDGRSIASISKSLSLKVGPYVKSITAKQLSKIKVRGQTFYAFIDWGPNGAVFELNADTGEFTLYVKNVDLDDSSPTLNTEINIQIDDVISGSLVSFKNISRKKDDHK